MGAGERRGAREGQSFACGARGANEEGDVAGIHKDVWRRQFAECHGRDAADRLVGGLGCVGNACVVAGTF